MVAERAPGSNRAAGYFPDIAETVGSLNFEEELRQIDICALGPPPDSTLSSPLLSSRLLFSSPLSSS